MDVDKISEQISEHLKESNETYFAHLLWTIVMSLRILLVAVVLLIHGFFPFLLTKSASKRIEQIYLIFKARIGKLRVQQLDDDWDI